MYRLPGQSLPADSPIGEFPIPAAFHRDPPAPRIKVPEP